MKLMPRFHPLAWIIRAHRRRTARRHLAELNDHLLRDIGIERGDIPYIVDGVAPPWDTRAETTRVFRLVPVMRHRTTL